MMVSKEDRNDILLANRFRLSLSKPRQSFFRVVALLFYKDHENKNPKRQSSQLPPWVSQRTEDGRTYIIGTNDEPGYMGGSICAERSAIVQLRFLPSARVSKLVICTDSTEPISPGMLCREFMAGHECVPWGLRILSTGCSCANCDKRDAELFASVALFENCADFIPKLDTTLKDLYPFPSPYTRCGDSLRSVSLGEFYARSTRSSELWETMSELSKSLLDLAIEEARSNVNENHPIQFGAAASFADGTVSTSHQSSALEYGCTLDAVSQLAPRMKKKTPKLLIQVDQFGVAHAPFAPARAFLSENGHNACKILVHCVPVEHDPFDLKKWSLDEILASDLAPNAPDWTTATGTDR